MVYLHYLALGKGKEKKFFFHVVQMYDLTEDRWRTGKIIVFFIFGNISEDLTSYSGSFFICIRKTGVFKQIQL